MPVAAGIGGGSADAAAALAAARAPEQISPSTIHASLSARSAVGADVPVCLASRARIMRGVGEQLSEPLDLPKLPALLVNPGVPLGTREVFSALAASQYGKDELDRRAERP